MPKKKKRQPKPYCFVSYSTRERHVQILIECLGIVFTPHFEIKLTPSALASGSSQRDQITSLIEKCAFAVVSLDGLRPNVVFEYGIIHAAGRPVILLKERDSTVDVRGYWRDTAKLSFTPIAIDLDSQFSDVKDVNCAIWSRFSVSETVKLVWKEYGKNKGKIAGYIDIEEPKLWEP